MTSRSRIGSGTLTGYVPGRRRKLIGRPRSRTPNIDLKSAVPALDKLVDRSYAFGVQMLARQRDFAKGLLAYAAPLAETLRDAPRQAERFFTKTERTAAKKAEEAAAKAEDVAAEAERTASKAQHSASARSGGAPAAKK